MATGRNRPPAGAPRGARTNSVMPSNGRVAAWSATAKAGIGLVIAGASALGSWLSPLKEYSLRLVYPENAQVSLTSEKAEVRPGDLLVFAVSVTPLSKIDVEPGELRIDYETSALELSGGEAALNTEIVSSTRKVDQDKFRFRVKQVAKSTATKVSATLRTKYGSYTSKTLTINILPIAIDGDGPAIRRGSGKSIDLTGTWSIEMGANLGNMEIKQDSRDQITGEYFLHDPNYGDTKGKIDGFKDGASFKVSFAENNGKKSIFIRIDSNFNINETDASSIELKGCAYTLKADKTVKTDDLIDKILPCKNRSYVNYRGVGVTNFTAFAKIR